MSSLLNFRLLPVISRIPDNSGVISFETQLFSFSQIVNILTLGVVWLLSSRRQSEQLLVARGLQFNLSSLIIMTSKVKPHKFSFLPWSRILEFQWWLQYRWLNLKRYFQIGSIFKKACNLTCHPWSLRHQKSNLTSFHFCLEVEF